MNVAQPKSSHLKPILLFFFIVLSYATYLIYPSEHLSGYSHAQAGKVHPADWIFKHGQEFVKNKAFCKACHGQDLSGGITPFKCNMCHLMPAHPADWKGTHGAKFLENKKQCTLCHGKQPFSGTKQPYSMNCTRCHSVNEDIARWQSESHTSQIFFNVTSTVQVRKDRFSKHEVATNNYAGFHLSDANKQIIASTQMRFARDWLDEGRNNFDLYEAYVELDNLFNNHLDITIGRQGFGSNIDFFIMDGVNFYIKPSKYFDLSIFTGIPRYVEQEDLSGQIGLVSGLSWILNEINYTNARIDFTYQKQTLTSNSLNLTDKMYIGASFSKGISIFKIYGLGEYDLTDTLPNVLTLGAEIHPFVKKVSFLIEGSYFNESRNDTLETVFTIFSVDALWQARAGVSIDLIKNLSIHEYFSFQRYEVLSGLHANGFNNDAGISYYFEKIKLDTALTYYFYKSYGGTLHGVYLNLYKDWNKRFFSSFFFDYMTYTKITNNDGNGINAIVEAGVRIIPGLKISAAAEYARNDVLINDLRGSIRLDYTFNKKYLKGSKAPSAKPKEREIRQTESDFYDPRNRVKYRNRR